MKKNFLYFIILIALCIVAYFTLIRDNSSSYSKKEAEFAIQDTTDIGRIMITSLKGDTIDLRIANGAWTFNKGQTPRPDAVHNLLRTLNQLEMKAPVAKSMHNTVVTNIAGRHTHVQIYDKEGEKMKGFYIGDNSDKLNGTFMLMEASEHPFIVNIPGFAGYAGTVFFTDAVDWRSKEVFAFKPAEIQQIDITYPNVKDSTFSLVKQQDGNFIVVSNVAPAKPVNQEIVQFYLKHFSFLNAEYYINDEDKRDSLLQSTPVCLIAVTDNQKTTTTIKLYYRPVTERTKSQFTNDDKPRQYDVDKFYGVFHNDADLAIIQNFVFGKVLIGPQYFYRQRSR